MQKQNVVKKLRHSIVTGFFAADERLCAMMAAKKRSGYSIRSVEIWEKKICVKAR